MIKSLSIILIYFTFTCPFFCKQDSELIIKILTVNVWSGLDYHGFWKYGEYESTARREKRFSSLIDQIRVIQPDIIFIQEANPVSGYSARLADSLDYAEIHHVCDAGIKFGPVGIPSNLKEGMAILARKELKLDIHDVWKLSGSFGLYNDLLSVHFDESIFALVGKIKIKDVPFYLIDVHLVAAPPFDSANVKRRNKEISSLIQNIKMLNQHHPVILAGDFNCTPDSRVIQSLIAEHNFYDTFTKNISSKEFTWDAGTNTNICFSTQPTYASGKLLDEQDRLTAYYDTVPRRIDYIFLDNKFSSGDIVESKIVLDSLINDVFASDHYGVYSKVKLNRIIEESPKETTHLTKFDENELEPLPILSYDTDAGFGYGAKAFFLNYLGLNESFDLVVFNSTKGERWYRFVFSFPDFELRQGKVYNFALDLIIDYDKWIKNSFFGIGNHSRFEDREFYTREPLDINISASRAFSRHFVGQAGFRYKSIRNFNFVDTSKLRYIQPRINSETARYSSFFLNFRYDTRNSFINPSRGLVLKGDAEFVPSLQFSNVNFSRLSLIFQHYHTFFYPAVIFAFRISCQTVIGRDLPIQVLSSVGGNNNLRGSPQDRYLDKAAAIANAEIRFPIYWRFGGIFGYDFGKVWNSIKYFDLTRWSFNPTVGLRFYMDTFVVRGDIGLGKETTGFYFNFGHIF